MPFPLTALLLDDMTGTNATAVTSRAGTAVNWGATRINAATAPNVQVLTNALGTGTAGHNAWFGAKPAATNLFGPDCEFWADVSALPGASQYIALFLRLNTVGGTTFNGYGLIYTHTAGSWQLRKYTAGVGANIGTAGTQVMVANDGIGIQILGSTLTCWRRNGAAGAWTQMATVTDTSFPNAGNMGVEFGDITARLDNLKGGSVPWPRTTPLGSRGLPQAVQRAVLR